MINAQKVLEHLDIPCDCYAVSVVRTLIEESSQPIKKASQLILEIVGQEKNFTNVKEAIHFTQSIVETARKSDSFDPELAMVAADEVVKRMRKDCPEAYVVYDAAPSPVAVVVDGIIQVTKNADGGIKKGGKAIIADDLYRRHVLCDKPVTQQEFVALLVKNANMSKMGASTYAGSTRKKLGGDFAPKS